MNDIRELKRITPADIGRLESSNHIIEDRAALDASWDRNGYWYFKGILNQAPYASIRRRILAELKNAGLVDADCGEPIWNGTNAQNLPQQASSAGYTSFPSLVHAPDWDAIVRDPQNDTFFTKVIGSKPDWLPIAETRITPPRADESKGVFLQPHQDGIYNEGYRCLIAWIPIFRNPFDTGGLAFAPGSHKIGYIHDLNDAPRFPIPEEKVHELCWVSADYEPGDVVIFDRMLVHAGRYNRSRDRFRVSFDIRCNLPGDPLPISGHIVEATDKHVVVRDTKGAVHDLPLNDNSFCRVLSAATADRIELSEVPGTYKPGQEVFITVEDGAVRLLRQPKY